MSAKTKASTQASSAPAAGGGAPRWTYVLGALVGAGTLVLGVASLFIPKPEPAKPPAAVATPASAPAGITVSVGGTQNVGVGVMSGGAIQIGASAAPTASTASAARP